MHALGAQRRALHDAETVLLVDDRQAQLTELDRFLDQRVRADDEVQRTAGELGLCFSSFFGRRRPGQERHAESRRLEQPADVDVMLLGKDLGRRHERDLEAVLHRDERGHQRDDGLPRPDVTLKQAVHRVRSLHVADNLANDLLLIAGQPERQYAPRRFTHVIGDDDGPRLHLRARAALAQYKPALEEEELLEDQAALRRRAERVELLKASSLGRKMRVTERRTPVDEVMPRPESGRKRIRQDVGQLRQRMVHEDALHFGRDGPGLLVDWNNSTGVERVVIAQLVQRNVAGIGLLGSGLWQDFVLRVLKLQPVGAQLELAVEDDALVRLEDVVEKRLVEPDGPKSAGTIADDQLEDLETRAPRRPNAAPHDLADDRSGDTGTKRSDCLECPAVLIADREAIEQVFNRAQTHPFEIGGAPGPDPLEVLQRRLQGIYCTTIASPFPTRISLIRAGSSKGSSMLMPEGFSADFE